MRIRKVASEQELERLVDEFITIGYTEQGDRGLDTIRMKKKNYGSLLAHIIILCFTWWSFGIINLIYALIKNHNADEVLIKIEGVPTITIPREARPQ